MRWIDPHCHLPDDVSEAAALVDDARAAGVDRLITVGTTVAHSRAALAVARAIDGVWATAGVHPHDASDGIDGLVDLFDEPEIVAVGECGLDHHYNHSPPDVQAAVFAEQIRLAHDRDLPLVIHTREAWDDTFAILEAEGVPTRTIVHCFTGGPAEAERALAKGAFLSFSGIVTFVKADDVRDAARLCPLDRLMVETDAPFLAPVPHRGRPNRPGLVPVVGAAVAAAKGMSAEEISALTWANAESAFGL